jgi:hypothetical protein
MPDEFKVRNKDADEAATTPARYQGSVPEVLDEMSAGDRRPPWE